MKRVYFLTMLAMLLGCLGIHAADTTPELTFSNVSLTPGSKVKILEQDQKVTFNTNMDDQIGYMLAEIKDETKGEIVLSRVTVYDPNFKNNGLGVVMTDAPQAKKDPCFTFVCPLSIKMIEGHNYSLILKAYVDKEASQTGSKDENLLAMGKISYEGASAPYVGSTIKLVSITPDPATHVINSADNRSITLTFNGMVRMDKKGTFVNVGNGYSTPYESITPGEETETVDDVVYSTSWTLTPSMTTISDGNDVIFVANAFDKDDLHVSEGTKYSTGADETSCYSITVANDLGRETFDITANENIKTLSSVVVSNASGIALANIKDPAVLYKVATDGTKTAVAQVTYTADLAVKKTSEDEVATSVRLMFDKAVTEVGNYVLSFPRNYFNIGTGAQAGSTAATNVEYTIAKEATPYTVAFTPADDEKVTKLSEITISFTDENEDNDPKYTLGCEDMEAAKAYIYNANKELVTTASFDYAENWSDYNTIRVMLKEPISEPGKYTLVVPDGQFTYGEDEGGMMARKQFSRGGVNIDDDDDDDEEEGEYNALIVKTFTVEAGSTEDVTIKMSIEDNAKVAKIEKLEITFDGAESVKAGSDMVWWKGSTNFLSCTSVEGNVATVCPSADGWDPTTIEKAGAYTLEIPAGYFTVNGNAWPENDIVLHITVDPTTGIQGISAASNAKAQTVYTLEGVKVDGSAKNLKGIFIVNGKKVVLK